MTDTADQPAPRPAVWADYPGVRPFAFGAAVAAVAGIVWFPCWFFGAQLLRLWATRGGMRWLRSRGVPEYMDERYATVIAWGAAIPIAARVMVAVNWLQPLQALTGDKQVASDAEFAAALALVLGLSIGTALSGVMLTNGRPRVTALVGLVAVVGLALAAQYSSFWHPNAFTAAPLMILGYLSSRIALFLHRAPERRARRRQRLIEWQAEEAEEQERLKQRGY
jgi:hypothetical protein